MLEALHFGLVMLKHFLLWLNEVEALSLWLSDVEALRFD